MQRTSIPPPGACGKEIVVRALRHGGVLGPLWGAAYWGTRRVEGELAATQLLRARTDGIVPQPRLALARRIAGPLWRCAIGTARVPGEPLAGLLLRAAPDAPARAAALRAAATAVRALHDAGGRHADLNASNVLIAASGERWIASIVDLDRARVDPSVPARGRAREIARLWRSLAKLGAGARLSASERDAFVGAYCAGDAALETSLRSHLRRERVRTALHALHYGRG